MDVYAFKRTRNTYNTKIVGKIESVPVVEIITWRKEIAISICFFNFARKIIKYKNLQSSN